MAWPHELAAGYASLGWVQLSVAGAMVRHRHRACQWLHQRARHLRSGAALLAVAGAVVTFMAVAAITASGVAALA
ncbi:hypothetical protein J2792_002860 [Novosphingobium capsulatum]|uniref:Uncharacterized protein n=1 Tax=Novosphingobium capsulatum TaxID=13688 RepID=A0ABU1MNZ5_9SPHN|nr:hypothetical protein [Novosphingobium capsulatum]MDR6511977.1 hypothetical protein [Novosphingobium capsulatum]